MPADDDSGLWVSVRVHCGAAGGNCATSSAMVFDRRFRLPMVQQGTLSLERELGWGMLARAEYEMNLDRQLPNSVDVEYCSLDGRPHFSVAGWAGSGGRAEWRDLRGAGVLGAGERELWPVTDVESNANATYNGLTLEARRGLGSGRSGYGGVGRGLEFRVAWTWSKAIDFGQNAGAVPRTDGQFDPFTVRYDKGLSALDFPHRVVAMAVWSPRLSGMPAVPTRVERAVWKLAEGWSISGIFSESSGRGYSYDVFGGSRPAGGRESINGSGGSTVLPTVGRNTLRLPDWANLDVRLSRSFRLSETLRLRGALEVFNVMNHQNISGVTQRAFLVGTPVPLSGTTGPEVTPLVFQDAATVATEGLNVLPFGAYTAAGTSQARERQVQMGLAWNSAYGPRARASREDEGRGEGDCGDSSRVAQKDKISGEPPHGHPVQGAPISWGR